MSSSCNIWCNAALSDDAMAQLKSGLGQHRLVVSTLPTSNLNAAGPDPSLAGCSIAFGQPDPQQIMDLPGVKWVHLTSAGYTRYDTPEFRQAIRSRGGIVTNSSTVYAEPCADHALAMVMALARQLPQSLDDQRVDRTWPSGALRAGCSLLSEQSMLIYGFGAIARRLVKLLTPTGMKLSGVRRTPTGDEGVEMLTIEQADERLASVDHVMNILPASPQTDQFFNADRLARISSHAYFYNIGRGSTVDQSALADALRSGKLRGAYLDVTAPEPLPVDHELWKLENCWITPHTAGGHCDEMVRLVKHFLDNLPQYENQAAVIDRII